VDGYAAHGSAVEPKAQAARFQTSQQGGSGADFRQSQRDPADPSGPERDLVASKFLRVHPERRRQMGFGASASQALVRCPAGSRTSVRQADISVFEVADFPSP
jgi:hypothetical protein